MSTLQNVTLTELQEILKAANLPLNTRVTVSFHDSHTEEEIAKQQALEAMKELRGSGKGRLLDVLLAERKREREAGT